MTPKDNILQELNELNSPLANLTGTEVYTVPAGYFEALADAVLNRIKALEAANATEELAHLSPYLSQLSKAMPYTIPAGYFESLQENIEYATTVNDSISSTEELETLSPLLSGLKKEMPFAVPQGYFDNLPVGQQEQARVVPMGMNRSSAKGGSFISRKWFKYAAAAVVVGIVTTTAFLFLNRDKIDPNDTVAIVKNKVKNISSEKLDEFVQLADGEKLADESIATANVKAVNIKELIKDVPESEIQSLLNDTQLLDDAGNDTNTASGDDIMMN
jgi:hypothetical protein